MEGEAEETSGQDPGVTVVQAELVCKAQLKCDPFEDGLLAVSLSPLAFPSPVVSMLTLCHSRGYLQGCLSCSRVGASEEGGARHVMHAY